MPNTAWLVSLAALVILMHNGCEMLGQKDKDALAPRPSQTPNKTAELLPTPGDSMRSAIPQVIHVMPSRRGRMLAELVDCNSLAALLPDSLPNMKRDVMIAERTVDDSILVSLAAGSYADPAGNNIEIKITDSGDLKVFAPAAFPWLDREIQSESESSYERTISFDGYRGFERYYVKDQSGEVYVFVGERFVVEVTGYGVMSEDLKNAVSSIDLHRLQAIPVRN
ncbi:MAG: hypothetical protein ACREOO_01310 [bacterium]